MKTIEQKYWNVIDLMFFREKLPELKFQENTSLTAILSSNTTPLIAQALKENKVFSDKPFSVRLDEYKLHLEKLFKEIDKKDEEVAAPQPIKKKN
jgi:hypothetical protein